METDTGLDHVTGHDIITQPNGIHIITLKGRTSAYKPVSVPVTINSKILCEHTPTELAGKIFAQAGLTREDEIGTFESLAIDLSNAVPSCTSHQAESEAREREIFFALHP